MERASDSEIGPTENRLFLYCELLQLSTCAVLHMARRLIPLLEQRETIEERVVSGSRSVALVEAFGFRLDRCHGSHHIFKRSDIGMRLNIQDCNGQAKPYQVRQFLQIVEQNGLKLGDDE